MIEWLGHAQSALSWLEGEAARAVDAGARAVGVEDGEALLEAARADDGAPAAAERPQPTAGWWREIDAAPAGRRAEAAWAALTRPPPLLHRWLLLRHRTAPGWYQQRSALTRSAAAGAACGWLLGLGGRTLAALLLDGRSGELVHCRLQSVFEAAAPAEAIDLAGMRALKLPPAAIEKEEAGEEGGEAAEEDDEEAPEALMPFRLTRELRDAFGPHAVATTFQAAAAHALRSLQAERASRELELLLDPLVDGGMGAVEAHRPQTGGAFGEVFADAATQSQEGTGTQAMDDDMEGDVGGDDLDGKRCEDDAARARWRRWRGGCATRRAATAAAPTTARRSGSRRRWRG